MANKAIARRAPTPEFEGDTGHVFDRIDRIKTVIAGANPATQAAALADLVAMFLAGQHPHIREQILVHHIQTVRDLIPQNEHALFGGSGFPAGWPR